MLSNGIHIGRRGGVRLTGGGEAEWTPAQLSTLAAWYDASDATRLFDDTTGGSLVAADGTVARIEDKSGSAFHLTQATAGARPTRKTAVRNGLDVLRNDGGDYLFRGTTNIARNVAGVTLAVVAAFNVPVAQVVLFGAFVSFSGSSRAMLSCSSANNLAIGGRRLNTDSFSQVGGGNFTENEWMILIGRINYATRAVQLYKNGGTAIASTGTFQTAGNSEDNDAEGVSLFGTPVGNNRPTGDFGESLFCNSALSNADLNTLGGYLAARWGLTWTAVA